MLKRVLLFCMVSLFIAAAIIGCTSTQTDTTADTTTDTAATTAPQTTTSAETEGAATPEDQELITVTVLRAGNEADYPNLYDESVLLDRFNLQFDYTIIPESGAEEKMNLMFATNIYPEFLYNLNYPNLRDRLSQEGYLLPVSDYWDQLPDYRALYTDEEWALMVEDLSTDGSVYVVPIVNFHTAQIAWVYRKSAFDAAGLSFPTTIDELYDVTTYFKTQDETAIPMTNRWGMSWMMSGVLSAFRTGPGFHVDVDSGELVFGAATDKVRNALIFLNKCYSEGLIDKEFATVTSDQQNELIAQGKSYIQYEYANRAPTNQTLMANLDTDEEVEWDWTTTLISAYNDKSGLADLNNRHGFAGPAFTNSATEEQVERILQWLNWISTKEGNIIQHFGVEGTTFEYVNGEPVYLSNMYSLDNPEGTRINTLGFWYYVAGFNLESEIQYFGTQRSETDDALKDSEHIITIPWKLNSLEEATLADLGTVLTDTRDEYLMRFIMGDIDPSDDAKWNDYLETLDGAYLEEILGIYQEALTRIDLDSLMSD